jgi:4'-phosphopantetheinyl transferase
MSSGVYANASCPMSAWQRPPPAIELKAGEVHVWRAILEAPPSWIQSLRFTLSEEELARADRFHFPRDRDRFVLARALLRRILARYAGVDPAELQFCFGPHGKPSLSSETTGGALRFNVSHSLGVALFAVSRESEVGVDIEFVRQNFGWEQIAGRFFSSRENLLLRTLPERARAEAFFQLWTRQEAYVKAIGLGLALSLDRPAVLSALRAPASPPRSEGEQPQSSNWSLRDLTPGEGFVGALAVEGFDWQLTQWQYHIEEVP